MKALLKKSSLVFLFCFISYSICHSAAKPKPSTEAFPNLVFENIAPHFSNQSSTYLPVQKNSKSKKGFFKSLFNKKQKVFNKKKQSPEESSLLSLIFGALSWAIIGIVLVLNSLSILLAFSFLFSIIGLISGIHALKNNTTKKKMAKAGIVLSSISAVLLVALLLLIIIVNMNLSD